MAVASRCCWSLDTSQALLIPWTSLTSVNSPLIKLCLIDKPSEFAPAGTWTSHDWWGRGRGVQRVEVTPTFRFFPLSDFLAFFWMLCQDIFYSDYLESISGTNILVGISSRRLRQILQNQARLVHGFSLSLPLNAVVTLLKAPVHSNFQLSIGFAIVSFTSNFEF